MMSKLYNQYIILKSKKPKKIFLFKNGIFFIFLDEDAKIMSKLLNLKLSNLNLEVVKCGFPINSLEKYMSILNNSNYDVEIVNSSNLKSQNFKSYNDNLKIENIILEISNIEIDSLSISQAYDFLYKIQNEISDIRDDIEWKDMDIFMKIYVI